MITMAQNPLNPDKIKMAIPAMPPDVIASPVQMAVNPHDTLTAPIGPPRMSANELGAPLGHTNELGDELPSDAPEEKPELAPKMSTLSPQKGQLNNKLMADYKKDNDPYGSADNHPGLVGKLLHGLSVAGNIAGDIASPTLMSRIPGSDLHRQLEEQGLEKRLQDIGKEESTENLQGAQAENQTAQAGEHTETTNEMPGKAADTHALTESEITQHNAQAAALLHPQAKTDFEAWEQQNPGKPIEDWLKLQSQSKNVKPDTPEQQYLDEYQQQHPGSSVASAERAYTLDTQRPPQIAPIMMMVPNANGGSTATVVRPGTEVAPGAQTAAGLNSTNTPTAQMRNTAQRAELVHAMTPEVLQNIDANAATLGPIMGHWNDFMQGKIGSNNPAFAQLRSDLLLYSSSVALAHAQGRLPENLREEFDRMINAPNQTPENLKAVIQEIDKAMQLNAQVMKGRPQPSAGAPPEGADVQVKGKDGKMYWGNSKTKQLMGIVQ